MPLQFTKDQYDDALRHWSFLHGGSYEQGVIQIYPDHPSAKPRVILGSLDEHFEQLIELNLSGHAIGVQVHGGTRRGSNYIRSAAEIFIDVDQGRLKTVMQRLEIVPTMVIRTTPGKHHIYLAIQETRDLNQVDAVTYSLCRKVCGDTAACQRAQVARLAGFYNQKANKAHPVRILEHHPQYVYTLAELAEVAPLGDYSPPPKPVLNLILPSHMVLVHQKWPFSVLKAILGKGLRGLDAAREGNRHNTLRRVGYHFGAMATIGLDAVAAYEMATAVWRGRDWPDRNFGNDCQTLRTAMSAGYQEATKTTPTPSPWTSMALERQAETVSSKAELESAIRVAAKDRTLPMVVLPGLILDLPPFKEIAECLPRGVATRTITAALRALDYREAKKATGRYFMRPAAY